MGMLGMRAHTCSGTHVHTCAQELAARPDVGYIAGGAGQNSIRVAQWMLQVCRQLVPQAAWQAPALAPLKRLLIMLCHAGGAHAAQVPHATAYMGCIGNDDFGAKMTETAKKDGVNVRGQ